MDKVPNNGSGDCRQAWVRTRYLFVATLKNKNTPKTSCQGILSIQIGSCTIYTWSDHVHRFQKFRTVVAPAHTAEEKSDWTDSGLLPGWPLGEVFFSQQVGEVFPQEAKLRESNIIFETESDDCNNGVCRIGVVAWFMNIWDFCFTFWAPLYSAGSVTTNWILNLFGTDFFFNMRLNN